MKKTFRFLALSFALICGTLSSWAAVPDPGTRVGATVSGGVVTYIVTGNTITDGTNTYYGVQINGLDADGKKAQQEGTLTELDILTTFQEKYGEVYHTYYVEEIVDASSANKVAFYAMTGLKKLTFRAADTEKGELAGVPEDKFTFRVGTYAFYGCTALEELTLPDNVKEIGKYAFQNAAITSFVIPAKCETIGENAFYNTQSLGTVTVSPEGNAAMTVLGTKVFANSYVNDLDLTNASALTTIANDAFIYDLSVVNNTLKTVELPYKEDGTPVSNFTTIGTAFANCTGLKSIANLEYSQVAAVGDGAFENCESLEQLNFPKTANLNNSGATSPFLGCKKLRKLTFADGWNGTIATGLYISTTGTKKGVSYTVTPDLLKPELSYLEEIEFMGSENGTIDAFAFGNADANKACSGLTTLTFDGSILEGATIGAGAFQNCAALATLTFAANDTEEKPVAGFLVTATKTGNITIGNSAFEGTALTAVDFKTISNNGAGVSAINIASRAFACDKLASVTFGNITYGTAASIANEVTIASNAFVSDLLTTVTFHDITAGDPANILTIGNGTTPAFAPKSATSTGVLKTVSFDNLTVGDFTINKYAFQSEVLTSVTIADITTIEDASGSLTIGEQAFGFYYTPGLENKAEAKTVSIGNIDESGATPATLTLTIEDLAFFGDKLENVTIGKIGANATTIGATAATDDTDAPFGGNGIAKTVTITNGITGDAVVIQPFAFYGDQLTTVQIGNVSATAEENIPGITGKSVTIGQYAFAGETLASVTIGDITSETKAEFAASAFANLNDNTDGFEAMTETVTIGKFGTANLDIKAGAFQGPKKVDSEFNVTIGDVEKAATVAAGAFVAPPVGKSSYTLGKIDATIGANVAFQGSKDAEGVNTTIVTIGDYNKAFVDKSFNRVNTVNIASWNVASNLTRFNNAINVNVLGDVTKNIGGAEMNSVKNITFGGNVKGAIIGGGSKFGTGVRSIKFTAKDPEVDANVFADQAFAAASDDAMNDENIVVVYSTETAIKSNNIFTKTTFGTDDTYKNVILYTDSWSKANTFENVEILADRVWRLTLSASDVVPGDPIEAVCVAQTGGKYAYGKLFVPAGEGMKYYVDAEVADKVTGVNLFSATIDGTDIRMKQVDIVDGKYWIDATEKNQVFVVRVAQNRADGLTVVAQEATDEIIAAQETLTEDDWFDTSLAKKNALRYTPVAIANQELQNNAEFEKKGIYVMANPKNNGLAFALLNQYSTTPTRSMAKKSLYVLTKTAQYAQLNVVWEDDVDEATAIQKVENKTMDTDAIYNLQGVRVKNAQKGIFIINGKKYVK